MTRHRVRRDGTADTPDTPDTPDTGGGQSGRPPADGRARGDRLPVSAPY
ncbi:hypothetical protein [Bifidobacterium scardovii]|nr:hypothetical protein [Bifidobacterium scardovii]MDK6350495.1 hypothetical protein [Bifidobacterium scardovii]MDU8981490.1 hypothetical protein [Bifidobacterium scardovii]